MTREEVIKLVRVISYSYTNFKPLDMTELVNTWYMLLEDESYNELSVALKSYIKSDRSGFAPTPGQLLQHSKGIQGNEEMNESEAWSYVSKAIARSTYYAEEEFQKLPPAVRKAVGNPRVLRELAAMPVDQANTVEKSLFQRTYRDVVKRINEINSLPADVKRLTNNTIEHYLGIECKNPEKPRLETKKEEPPGKPISWDKLQELYKELRGSNG